MTSVPRNLTTEHQRTVVKLFHSLTGRNTLWQLWADFVAMSAISISNTIDKAYAEQREQMYMTICKRYNQKELDVFAQILAEIVMGMEETADQDFLGELYMALELGNDRAGQFFTPYCVCRMMAEINAPGLEDNISRRGWISCNDCAAGAGATLIAFANVCRDHGINYQTKVLFVAQELDFTTALMCYLQLSLLGCAGYVIIQNTLTNPGTSFDEHGLLPNANENYWFTPGYFRGEWTFRRILAQFRLVTEIEHEEPITETVAEPPEPVQAMPVFSEMEGTGQLSLF